MSESFAQLLEESLANQQIRPGAILTGTVIDVNSDVVIVNADLKSEAVIPANQFLNDQGEIEVVVGDDLTSKVLDAIQEAANTGRIGDGKIFVIPVGEAVRIRTGDTGEDAI